MGQYIQDKKTGQMKGMIGDGKANIPTAGDTATRTPPPASTEIEAYPLGASRDIINEWSARLAANREADRIAHDAWRTENYPADVRGSGHDYPFTQEFSSIRAYTAPNGDVTYSYPSTAFEEKSEKARILNEETQIALDELVESGLSGMDENGVWRVDACESVTHGYNHDIKVLKEEYGALPPMHKFILAHATGAFGSSMTGRNIRISGND